MVALYIKFSIEIKDIYTESNFILKGNFDNKYNSKICQIETKYEISLFSNKVYIDTF